MTRDHKNKNKRVQRHTYSSDRQLHECSFGNGRPTRENCFDSRARGGCRLHEASRPHRAGRRDVTRPESKFEKVKPNHTVQRPIYISVTESYTSVLSATANADTWHTTLSAMRRECISSPASRLGRQGQAHTLSIESQELSPESLWRKDHAGDSATAVKCRT